jgi:soluble lytic murein transglycosylase-like protein
MPSTFTEITEDRLKEGLDPIKRLDPDTNIKYGTYYLSYLFARYGDWDAVFAAYNGGLGNVDEWMGEDEKLTLDEISFKETRNYVKKVNNAIEKYKKLYAFDK